MKKSLQLGAAGTVGDDPQGSLLMDALLADDFKDEQGHVSHPLVPAVAAVLGPNWAEDHKAKTMQKP